MDWLFAILHEPPHWPHWHLDASLGSVTALNRFSFQSLADIREESSTAGTARRHNIMHAETPHIQPRKQRLHGMAAQQPAEDWKAISTTRSSIRARASSLNKSGSHGWAGASDADGVGSETGWMLGMPVPTSFNLGGRSRAFMSSRVI